MKVSTPAMKLNVRVDSAKRQDGRLVLHGVAGMMPCETSLSAAEVRKLILMVLNPRILPVVFARDPS